MVRDIGFGIHANDNSEETTQFRHDRFRFLNIRHCTLIFFHFLCHTLRLLIPHLYSVLVTRYSPSHILPPSPLLSHSTLHTFPPTPKTLCLFNVFLASLSSYVF